MRSIAIIAIGMCLVLISACDKKNLPDKGATNAEKVSNEWWVVLSQGGNDLIDPSKISTYNTSLNPDSIWIDDLENIWPFKCKAKIDLANMTFSTANAGSLYDIKVSGSSPAQYYRPTVTIANGKILSKAAKSLSGNTTDSIYMELEFSDDPGTKYVLAGHARTMFSEDEY
jgi:hypothetical protein